LVVALACSLALAGALALARSGGGTPRHVTSASVNRWTAAAAGQRVGFTLVLRLPGAARLQAALAEQEDPSSRAYGQTISPRAFGERFGVSERRLAGLVRALQERGVSVLTIYPQRTAVLASATVATIERVFGLRIEVERAHRAWRRALGRVAIPASLSAVSGVTGLDTRPRWRSWEVPPDGLTPVGAAAAYDIGPLHARGVLGQGLTIAVISFSDFDHTEPATFAQRYGLSGPAPQIVPIDGGTFDLSGADESNLDIDVIRSIAPEAQIRVFQIGESSAGLADALNAIVAHRSATIVSTSWGQCELGVDSGELAADRQAIAAARAAGISIFAATGDLGAFDCQAGNLPDHTVTVDWPAASRSVVAVGGTRLNVESGGRYASESAWEDVLSGQGSGGGFSRLEPQPAWQRAAGVGRGVAGAVGRGLPDVAADADPGTGWSFYSSGRWGAAGGTSAAAPFWAAAMLLVGEYASAHGAHVPGFVTPLLYALAAGGQHRRPFHDVTLGSNRFYSAAAGWDPATGLGSPDVYNLARDVVDYLHGRRPRHPRAHPAR
jgi:kumamolisin